MKRFRLDITGKLEDRPRMLRAYGRIPGGEVALVLRPTAYGGVLVHVTKEGATQWSASDEVPAGWARVRAQIVRGRAELRDGPSAGRVLPLTGPHADGFATVAVAPELDRATAVPLGDAPLVPDAPLDPADAVRAVKRAQTHLDKPGPTTLRGQWAGSLVWDEGPYVELRRKLATYGSLVVTSGADGWRWAFEREERWFTPAGHLDDGPFATLVQAIDAGMLGALGLVQAACGVRDTRRRQGLDADWAASHPLPVPPERADPTERLRDRSSAAPARAVVESTPTVARASRPKPSRAKGSGRGSASSRAAAKAPITASVPDVPCGCAVPDGPAAGVTAPKASKPPRVSKSHAAKPSAKTRTPRPAPPAEASAPAAADGESNLIAAFSAAVAAALTD